MDFRKEAKKMLDEISGIESEEIVQESEKNDFDLVLDCLDEEISKVKIEEHQEVVKESEIPERIVEDFRPKFLGKLNESPNPQEYPNGTMYKDTRSGTVYIVENGLWESLVEDGKQGTQGRSGAAGSGTGIAEVETVVDRKIEYLNIKHFGIYNSVSELRNLVTSSSYPNLKVGDVAYVQLQYERRKYIYSKSVFTNEYIWAWDVVVDGGILYGCYFYDYPNTYDGTITWKSANNGLVSLPNSVSATSRSQFGRDPIFPKELFKLGRQIRWKFIGGYPMYDAATTLGVRLYAVSGSTQIKLDQCQFTRSDILSGNSAFPTGNLQKGGNFGGFGAIQPSISGDFWSGRFHGEFDLDNNLTYLAFRELGDVVSTGNIIPDDDIMIGLSLWVSSGASPNAGISDQFWVEVV